MSPDGTFIAGSSNTPSTFHAVLWHNGVPRDLGVAAGAGASDATGVSADGSVVCANSNFMACVWTEESGMVGLGNLSGGGATYATGISGDGRMIVGYTSDQKALLWTAETGLVDVNVLAASQGVDLTGWQLTRTTAISTDGNTIVGIGYFHNATRGWMIRGLRTQVLAPVAQVVNLGKLTRGNLASLAADDNDAQIVCKFILPNQSAPIISTQLKFATTVSAPATIDFAVKAKWNNSGSLKIGLWQFNYNKGSDDLLLEANLGGSYTTYTGSAAGDLSEYVAAGSGETRARVTVRQTGPSSALLPCVSIEYANQIVTP
ncbi:MAG: hypothetical protein JST30_13530 [Armatimonadetes bacterium]|nr:hypothetical protein [Armatimonadota bacterium]